MKRPNLILTTPYPYTAAIIAVIWLGSVILIGLPSGLPTDEVLITDSLMSALIAVIGFKN